MPEDVKKEALRELDRLVEDARRGRRIHRRAHLHRLARRAAVGEAHRRGHRPRQDQGRARRRSLRPRAREGPHPRVPRGPQAQARREGPDPVLRRPSGRRQDVARAVDRDVARPQVRARVARRHARRGRNPRSSPDVHRRAARPDHPGPAPRRVAQPGVHPRRDRQARHRLPRRPGVGAPRGARSGAEQHVPRSLPRRAVRSVRGAVHHDGQRARHDSGAAARPHGSARAAGLHRGREAAHRARPPRRAPGRESRADRPAQVTFTDEALRPRSSSGYTREAGVRKLEREIGAICRKLARRHAEGAVDAGGRHAAGGRRAARRAASTSTSR